MSEFIEYHLRVSVSHENCLKVIDAFTAKFKPIEWVCGFETVNVKYHQHTVEYSHKDHCKDCKINIKDKDGKEAYEINPHIHTYLKYHTKKLPSKQQISEFFKIQPIIKTKNCSGYSHKSQKKTTEEHLEYIVKDLHIISKNINNEILSKAIEKTIIINENKKLSSKEKLYNKYIESFGLEYPSSKYDLFIFIDETYVIEWNKTPLNMTHKVCYALYILIRIHKEINKKDNDIYQILSKDIYGIKFDYGEYRDGLIRMKNNAFMEIQEEVLENKIKVGKLKREYGAIYEAL